jgi:hypothetical protein
MHSETFVFLPVMGGVVGSGMPRASRLLGSLKPTLVLGALSTHDLQKMQGRPLGPADSGSKV